MMYLSRNDFDKILEIYPNNSEEFSNNFTAEYILNSKVKNKPYKAFITDISYLGLIKIAIDELNLYKNILVKELTNKCDHIGNINNFIYSYSVNVSEKFIHTHEATYIGMVTVMYILKKIIKMNSRKIISTVNYSIISTSKLDLDKSLIFSECPILLFTKDKYKKIYTYEDGSVGSVPGVDAYDGYQKDLNLIKSTYRENIIKDTIS